MRFIPPAIVADLSARGVALRKPAGESDIAAFELAMNVRLGRPWRQLYSLFNGFELADDRSQIFLWGLDEITQRTSAVPHLRLDRSFAIGDVLIDSDFLMSDLTEESSVSLLFEKRVVADSVVDLSLQLASGKIDLLSANHPWRASA